MTPLGASISTQEHSATAMSGARIPKRYPAARPWAGRNRSTLLARIETIELLDFFEKCPRCGYSAEATATVRHYTDGQNETTISPRCAMPCGWRGMTRPYRARK